MSRLEEVWTEQQRQAIRTIDRSVLVGAAAGSGKTAVLARRCAYLVGEAPPKFRCDLDDLLVVTFTEAAAAEMRIRIGRALRGQLDRRPGDAHLRYQLARLEGASISTIHSFCKKVLTKWFAAADLDPAFDILDPDEQLLLQQDAVRQVFGDLYEDAGPDGKRFREFIDLYGEGNDARVADRVIFLAEYLNSVVDPSAWLRQARRWCAAPQSGSLPSELADTMIRRVRKELHWQHRECRRAIDVIQWRYPSASWIVNILHPHSERLADWAARCDGLDAARLDELIAGIRDYEFPARRGGPRLPKDAPAYLRQEKENADRWHARLRNAFRSRLQERWCLFTAQEMSEGLARVAPFVDGLVDWVERFARRYRQLKEQDGKLDFADLERKTLNLLTTDDGDSEVLRSLRKQYRYVCVDEFQDVNPVQERIIRLVSREETSQWNDNLFCVGDVKQSIYRFRLAEPDIFVARQGRLVDNPKAGVFISLRHNFRSRRDVLEGINAIFQRLMTRQIGPIEYDEDAQLRAGLEYPAPRPDSPCVEMHLVERTVADSNKDREESDAGSRETPAEWEVIEREAYLAGRRVLQLLGREPGHLPAVVHDKPSEPGGAMQPRPIEYRDIVVLLRSPRHKAGPFARILASMGIPVHAELATGYFESTEVRDLLSLLSLLDNRKQDIPLAAVMRSPLFEPRFDESDLVRMRACDEKGAFHKTFELYARKGNDADLARRCGMLSRMLDRYRDWVRRRPLADAVWQIYTETGCLAYVAGLPGGRQRRANLIKLHERARQFGTFARQGLYRFLHFIEQLEESGQDLGTALPASESDDVVRIMSIHGSKGLEFPVVVLPDLAKSFNFDDSRGRLPVSRECYIGPKVIDPELEIEYPSVAHTLAAEEIEAQTRAEEMRVLYVAMTRARERLILIGSVRLENVGPDRLAAEWAGHVGPLPPLVLSSANSYLDWLLPTVACQQKDPAAELPSWIAVHTHTGEEIRDWTLPQEIAAEGREDRLRIADLRPLPPDEPVAEEDEVVRHTLRRIREPYAHDELTTIPSVLAVTELKRRHDATRELDDQTRELAYVPPHIAPSVARIYPRPERKRGATDPDLADRSRPRDVAAERGIATHLLLQHVDVRTATDPDKLGAQVNELIDRRLLTKAQADLIDLDAVHWFFETQLGRTVQRGADRLRREVMFVSRIPPELFDPAVSAADQRDVVLIRGIIDVLLIDKDGCQVIDYKTDDVGRDDVPARAESYRPQMDLYARAAGELGVGPVTRRWLVFLTPRQVWDLT